jgi:hypothetical protein
MFQSNKPSQSKLNFTFWGIIFLLIFINDSSICQNKSPLINDGPYIDYQHDSLNIRWIENGKKKDTLILAADAIVFDRPGLPFVSLKDITTPTTRDWEYNNVETFYAMSDLHGQFDIFVDLLKSNKIVDDSLNWNFGTNHLIITGDHFSRGDKVMEILWLLYKLDQQASEAGGHVHVMLGNHELMTLNNDLRYLNRKYAYTASVLGTIYGNLFSSNSVLGAWLRSKHVVLNINDIIFVHGGLSMDAVSRNLSLGEINQFFKDSILSLDAKTLSESELADFILGNNGPLWYRGYADASFQNQTLDTLLNFYSASHIIVGHTSMDKIITAFSNRIIFIDCSIKLGEKGEALYYHKGKFSTFNQSGNETLLFEVKPIAKQSLFSYIYNQSKFDKESTIVLKTNMKGMIRNKIKEEFELASFQLLNGKNEELITLNGRLRARGNIRKSVCKIPPVKFDFRKKELSKYNFAKADKLKFVFPCRDEEYDQEKLNIEFFSYELYSLIDSNSVQANLVNVKIINENDEVDYHFKGIILEDEDAYAIRNNAIIVGTNKKVVSHSLERNSFLKMFFFQFLIGNTDWSIGNRHNVFIVKKPELGKVIAIPYDFDYSGIVNQRYALPFKELNIQSVKERHFMPYDIQDDEVVQMIYFYKSKRSEIFSLIENADYLNVKSKSEIYKYIIDFYKLLDDPKKLKNTIVKE